MFDNIGGKIKSLATIICVVGMVASLIAAIGLWEQHDQYNSLTRTYSNTIWDGICVLLGGCIGSWTGCFCLYGFGELIDETTLTRQINQQILQRLSASEDKTGRSAEPVRDVPVAFSNERRSEGAIRAHSLSTGSSTGGWICKKCGTRNGTGDISCKDCGAYK